MQVKFSKLAGHGTLSVLVPALLLVGCNYMHVKPADKYVYVTAKEAILRDRVAAVSNRTGTVTNGEKLVVLDHARHFVKVRTPQGEIGWLEDKPSVIADQPTADSFETLRHHHEKDPVVGTATVRDEVVMHLSPGRQTPSFYRLNEGDSLSMLERATVEKPGASTPRPPAPKPSAPATAPKPPSTGKASSAPQPASNNTAPAAPPAPVMEDWWLVRDAKGDTGWIYSRMMDTAAPDALVRYAEGQHIVGAYLLTNVDDPDSGIVANGQPVTSIPEYVTVLAPYKAGLPYDFDQVRVFTWNTKVHRYETAFREHGIEGYLPVQIAAQTDPYGKSATAQQKLPTFTYRVLSADMPTPTPDPQTGELKPGKLIDKTYRLEGNICRRILPPGTQPPAEAHTAPEEKAPAKKKK